MIKKRIMKNKTIVIIHLLFVTVLLAGCGFMTTSIEDVKHSDYEGKTVTVYGTVQDTIKIGELSGYTLKDETGTISVSSQNLPQEESKIRVTGTLVKDTLLGYYIKVN